MYNIEFYIVLTLAKTKSFHILGCIYVYIFVTHIQQLSHLLCENMR